MSNSDASESKSQEQFPDLYKLLGLSPLETDVSKIQRSLIALQKRAEASQVSDPNLAQRAARIAALGKKNLLDADRKQAYDRAWSKVFGSNVPVEVAATAASTEPTKPLATRPLAVTSSQPAAEPKSNELEWDLTELEACLPAEDPRAPFDLGGFLRYSASLPETNPANDYEKLQSFLGGAPTATMEAPKSVSAAELMRDFTPAIDEDPHQFQRPVAQQPEQIAAPDNAFIAGPRVAPGGIAKQIRRKRNREMLLNIGGIAAALAMVLGGSFFYLTRKPDAKADFNQLAQATSNNKPKSTSEVNKPADAQASDAAPVGSGLPKVSGLDGEEVVKPDPMQGMMPDNAQAPPANAMQSNEPMPTTPAVNNPPPASNPTPADPAMAAATPAMTATPPATPTEPPTEPSTEPATAPPPADPVLTAAEKQTWSKAMKETLKTLGMQNFKLAKEQLAASEKLAKTQLQREQHKRLTTLATLTEEFHGFLVQAVTGLDAAETFKIGRSLEASFIEGNETSISVKIRGQIQTFALTELQIGLAMGLVDLKMDTEHPSSLARKAAFALVHPKTNGLALKAAREQMVAAAAAGAVEADLPNIFDEDYSLK